MRVSHSMVPDMVSFNLNRSLTRYMELQSMMSSGRRINVPSDDPTGTQKDMQYRTVLAQITQYQSNISYGNSMQTYYESSLREIEQLISDANVLAVGLANGDYDANARQAGADDIHGIFEAILTQVNSQVQGKYIYSGFRTQTRAFELGANGVEYMGDLGVIRTEIEPGSKVQVNMIGSQVFMNRLSVLGEKADLKLGIGATTLLADLNMGAGVDLTTGQFIVTDANKNISVTLDVSGAVTLDDAITAVNSQLVAGGITNLTLGYSLGGSQLEWKSTPDGLITGSTKLVNLNSGSGVNLLNGTISIANADESINLNVDLSGAVTIDDVIQALNNAFAASSDPQVQAITASINAAGTGIDITDPNNLGLTISDTAPGSTTAEDLGIAGEIGFVLNGADLNPRTEFSAAESAAGQTTAGDLGISGVFYGSMEGQDLNPRLTTDTPLSLLNNGHGLELGQLRISLGRTSRIVDMGNSSYATVGDLINAFNNCGLRIEASINAGQTGIQIIPTVNNASLIIDEIGGGSTAHDMGIFGSPDIFGSLILLEQAMRNDDQVVVGQLIGNFEECIRDLLTHEAQVGTRVVRMESTQARLSDMSYTYRSLLSEVEDADLTQLVTDLAMQQTSYQAALIAASKIIQPTLLDFLT